MPVAEFLDSTLDSKDAAKFLGFAENTLAVWRCKKRHPIPYIKIGRAIRYRKSDLEKFLTDRAVGDSAR